ncbi:hypothetical protein JCM13591A_38620 [Microbacterium xylanilyticum]
MVEPSATEESRLIFGNSHMTAVIVEIAGLNGERFSSKQIADATHLSPGIVHPLIQKLRRARWIEFVERVPGERTILYQLRDNEWWDAARRRAERRTLPDERTAS